LSDESNKKIEFLAAIFKEAFRGTESNTRKASFLFIIVIQMCGFIDIHQKPEL
jgi:hypothetical protein